MAMLSGAAVKVSAQEVEYALPRTVIRVEVTAQQEVFCAGPYARYAQKYLGIDVRQQDETICTVTSINIIPKVEADQQCRYAVTLSDNQLPTYLQLTSQGLISAKEGSFTEADWAFTPAQASPLQNRVLAPNLARSKVPAGSNSQAITGSNNSQTVVVRKTPETKAEEAAAMIFSIRDQRYKILTGDTDATYSGEAMKATMDELAKMETEYLEMFIGTTSISEQQNTYEIIPAKGEDQSYEVFSTNGGQWTLTLTPGAIARPPMPAKKGKAPTQFIHYLIPTVCGAEITNPEGTVVLQTRIPVFQLGTECTYPLFN